MSNVDNTQDLINSQDVIERIEELEGRTMCDNCGEPARVDTEWGAVHEKDGSPDCRDDETIAQLSIPLGDEETQELANLKSLAEEAAGYAPDWEYGETLIRDSYFQEYAQDLAEGIGAIDSNASWPLDCIDWEHAARELRYDYTCVTFDGVTYWIR